MPSIAMKARLTTAIATVGSCHARYSTEGTAKSPSSDMPTLLSGSGEVLTAARVVAFAMWLVAASVPPSSAATVAAVA